MRPKYNLVVNMNTDDDCPILYKGKPYCFYDDDLKISVDCNSITEIVDVLICQIKVVDGYKASAWTRKWLDDISKEVRKGETYFSISGNQKYDVWISENTEEIVLTEPEYYI